MYREYYESQLDVELKRDEFGENAFQFRNRIEQEIKSIKEIYFIRDLNLNGEQIQKFQSVIAGIEGRFDILMKRRGL